MEPVTSPNSTLQTALSSTGLSLRALAREIGISHTYLTKIAAGKVYPSEPIRMRLLQYFKGYRSEDLFGPPVQNAKTGPDIICKRCHSPRVIKYGISQGCQRYYCNDCACVFISNDAPLYGHLPVADLVMVMQRFFEGLPLDFIRNAVQDSHDFPVTVPGLERIIRRYSRKAVRLAADILPVIGPFWYMDGESVTESGKLNIMDILDLDTGFIIASDILSFYPEADRETVLDRAFRITGLTPQLLFLNPDLMPGDASSSGAKKQPPVLNSRQTEIIQRYRQTSAARLPILAHRLSLDSLANNRLLCQAWRINYNYLSHVQPAGASFYNSWLDIINAPDAPPAL